MDSVKSHRSEKAFYHGEHRGNPRFNGFPPRLPRSPRFNVFLVVGALAVSGCDKATSVSTTIAHDSAGVRIVDVTVQPSSLPQWTLDSVPVRVMNGMETGDETAFAFVGPVRFLQDGGLVVGDVASSRLLIYDAAGRFARALARRGDGPGEIRRLESITVDDKGVIAAFDASLRRLSFWKPDSGFVRSVSIADGGSLEAWPADAMPWRDSLVVVFQLAITPKDSVPKSAGLRRWWMRAHLTLRDTAGRIVKSSPTFNGMYSALDERGDTRLPFSNRPFVAHSADRVYFGSGDIFQLSFLDTTFQVSGVIRWTAREEMLTTPEVNRVQAEANALISRRPMPPDPFDRNFSMEILPTIRPSIGRVFVGSEGLIWIERFEAIRLGTAVQVPGDQWSILRESGEPIAILKLPPMTRLEDVRGDDVVVVRRDSLDVQTVAIHRLRR